MLFVFLHIYLNFSLPTLIFETLINTFLVPTAFFYYWFNSKMRGYYIMFALFFSWMGNLFLLVNLNPGFQKWIVFLFWLSNSIFFIQFIYFKREYFLREHVLGLIFYFSYLAVFLNHVYSSLGEMKLLALVHGLTTAVFGSFTVMQLFKKFNTTKLILFLGLLFLSVKDVMLTYNKRFFEEEFFSFPIPIFQLLGLFLLLGAFINLERREQEELYLRQNEEKFDKLVR